MAIATPIEKTPGEVRELLSPLRNDFSIAVQCASNAFAVGAIIRIAHNFLAREVFLIGDAPYYEKASMGMEKYETIVRAADDDAFFEMVEGRPVWAFEKEAAERSLYADAPFPKGVVFAFGSERFGLGDRFLERADAKVAIPIYGVNNSLPLAVATGIVMSEWARRHYAEGLSL